jgi:hypothetical protein
MIDVKAVYFDRIDATVATAETWLRGQGSRLRQDAEVSSSLTKLASRLDDLDAAMKDAGFPRKCGACARNTSGGCCDASIAKDAYALLLLVNLLLGARIDRQRERLSCCTFLGEAGCTLRAKPLICWNYNCHEIHEELPVDKVAHVESLVARALGQLIVVEGHIVSVLGIEAPRVPGR